MVKSNIKSLRITDVAGSVAGRKKLVDNGFQYVLDKRSRDGQKLFWRCDRKANRCPARLHTNATADDVVGRMREHNHLSGDAAALRVNRTRTTGSGVRQRTDRTAVQVHCMIIYAVINTLLLTRTCSLCITRRFQFTR